MARAAHVLGYLVMLTLAMPVAALAEPTPSTYLAKENKKKRKKGAKKPAAEAPLPAEVETEPTPADVPATPHEAAPVKAAAFATDRLASPLYAAAAQYYQVAKGKAGLGFDYLSGEGKSTSDVGGYKYSGSGINFPNAYLVYAALPNTLTVGIEVKRETSESKTTNDNLDVEFKIKGETTTISPMIVFSALPSLALAAQYDLVSEQEKFGDEASFTMTYNRFIPSIIYHKAALELGLEYKPTINLTKSNGDLSKHYVVQPGETNLFAQMKANPTLVVGGKIGQIRNVEIDDDSETNSTTLGFAAELWTSQTLLLSGGLGYETAHYKDSDSADTGNIPNMSLRGGARMRATPALDLGASLLYMFGSESTGGKKISSSATALSLTTAYTF